MTDSGKNIAPPDAPLILVAIFDDQIWRVVEGALKGKYRIRREVDGLRAMDTILLLRPSAVISETGLPGLSGILLARLIGYNRHISKLPVALIMSREYLIEEFWAKESGADVIVKKSDAVEAVRRIEYAITNRQTIPDPEWEEAERTIQMLGGPAAGVANELERQLIGASIIGHLGEIEIEAEPQNGSYGSTIPAFIGHALSTLSSVIEFAQVGIVLFNSGELYVVDNEIYSDVIDAETFIDESRNSSGLYSELIDANRELTVNNLPSVRHQLPGTREPASTYFALPLTGRSGSYGLLSIMTYKQIAVREYYLHTLSLIGKQLSVTLERALFYEEVRRLSVTDSLTTLSNRRALMSRLENEFTRARRYKSPFSIAIADLDDFKKINDTYGHLAGDAVLRAVSAIMKESVRTVDFAGRWGGEEIALMFPQTNLEGALIACSRLRTQIEELVVEFEGVKLKVTLSIGVATLNHEDYEIKSVDDMVALADTAMYLAKASGKNQVKHFLDLDQKELESKIVHLESLPD
ncbi:MAG TPA: diguanylate cyclase [bacterium]